MGPHDGPEGNRIVKKPIYTIHNLHILERARNGSLQHLHVKGILEQMGNSEHPLVWLSEVFSMLE